MENNKILIRVHLCIGYINEADLSKPEEVNEDKKNDYKLHKNNSAVPILNFSPEDYKNDLNYISDESYNLMVVRDMKLGALIDAVLSKCKVIVPLDDLFVYANKHLLYTTDGGGWVCYERVLYKYNDSKIYNNKDNKEYLEKGLDELSITTSTTLVLSLYDLGGTKIKNLPLIWGRDTRDMNPAFAPDANAKRGFPKYNISTRLIKEPDLSEVNIIPPSVPGEMQLSSGILSFLPSVFSALMFFAARTMFRASTEMFVMSGVMLGASLVTGIGSIVSSVFTSKGNYRKWKKQYEDYIGRIIKEINDKQEYYSDFIKKYYPSVNMLVNDTSFRLENTLYSRVFNDDDFLTVALGSADIQTPFEIIGEAKEEIYSNCFFTLQEDSIDIFKDDKDCDETADKPKYNLSELPEVIRQKFRLCKSTYLYSFKEKQCLGIVSGTGDAQFVTDNLLYRIIFDICYHQSPEAVQFIMMLDEKHKSDIEKYFFMPHFHGLFTERSQFVTDKAQAAETFSLLHKFMIERQKGFDPSDAPRIMVIVYDDFGMKNHALAQYMPKVPPIKQQNNSGNDDADNNSEEKNSTTGRKLCNDLGMTFIFYTESRDYLSAYCDDVIEYDAVKLLIKPHMSTEIRNASVSSASERVLTDYTALDIEKTDKQFDKQFDVNLKKAYDFLSTVYYDKKSEGNGIPSNVDFFDLYGIQSAEGIEAIIDGQAQSSDVTESISAPIGKTTDGKLVELDLHEKKDGPHMLVAGTTGSGKTETVLSYLLSLCMKYSPEQINLLLIDMKGGGFTKRLGDLPHVAGKISDIDGSDAAYTPQYMLGRFLDTVRAEIVRRKKLLSDNNADSIDNYIKLKKEEKLPHLILVVDEFTELKRFSSENNDLDYMSEITTIARIGRSLGIHILLISQNIEGAITDDIRANVNARLCLKVASKAASKEMIGTDLAGLPTMPGNGRAYLSSGAGMRLECFQAAYSGASAEKSIIPVEITEVPFTGTNSLFFSSLNNASSEGTQLQACVEVISKKWKEKQARQVFPSPLPNVIRYPSAAEMSANPVFKTLGNNIIPIGVIDNPQKQEQTVFGIDTKLTNIAILGSHDSGKSTFIKNILYGTEELYLKGEKEHVYIIDYDRKTKSLGYDKLNCVCGCFYPEDTDYIKHVLYKLGTVFGKQSDCHITLIIENLSAFINDEVINRDNEFLVHLFRDGLSSNLSVIFTAHEADRISRIISLCETKLLFRSQNDISSLLDKRFSTRGLCAGRCYISTMEGTYEMQCYSREEAPVSVGSCIENPEKIVPFDKPKIDELETKYHIALPEKSENEALIGINLLTHRPVSINIAPGQMIGIYGTDKARMDAMIELLVCKSEPNEIVIVKDSEIDKKSSKYQKNCQACSLEDFKNNPGRNRPLSGGSPEIYIFECSSIYNYNDDATGDKGASESFIKALSSIIEKKLVIFSNMKGFSRRSYIIRDYLHSNMNTALIADELSKYRSERKKTIFEVMSSDFRRADSTSCMDDEGYYYDIENEEISKIKVLTRRNENE